MTRARDRRDDARRRAAFTLIEVLVVVAIIALLIAILLPSLSRAKEVSKRTICLHNLKMLGQGWQMYQTENKGAFVRGQAASLDGVRPAEETDPTWLSSNAPSWVRFNTTSPTAQPVVTQIRSLQTGALYKYARFVDVYHCPSTAKNEIRTYSTNWGISGNRGDWDGHSTWRIDQLTPPSSRMVFFDDFPDDWDAIWMIEYWEPRFWNPMPMRHDKGSTLAFGDGHSDFWRWTDKDTIAFASQSWIDAENSTPALMPLNRDLLRLQRAVWGKLTYTPAIH